MPLRFGTTRLSGSFILLAALPLLAGCGAAGDAFGINKRPPDEFSVVAQPPLVLPPEYHLLPPSAADPRPDNVDSQSLAVQTLFPGRTNVPPAPSAGEQSLLRSAGAQTADSSIKSELNSAEDNVAAKGNLTADILKSGKKESDTATIERLDATVPAASSDDSGK
jgi:hypothetical protein